MLRIIWFQLSFVAHADLIFLIKKKFVSKNVNLFFGFWESKPHVEWKNVISNVSTKIILMTSSIRKLDRMFFNFSCGFHPQKMEEKT